MEEMTKLIEWMLEGNQVEDKDGNKWILRSLDFADADTSKDSSRELTVNRISEELKIYKTPQQLYIEELEAKVKTYEQRTRLRNSRRGRNNLGPGEVKDIEEAIRKSAENQWIMSTYNIAASTLNRIKNGIHKYSTNKNVKIEVEK